MFDSTDPTILALRTALGTKVADYKLAAESYGAKEDVSISAMLALPLSDDAQLILDYVDGNLGKVLDADEHDGLTFEGNENVYAHMAQKLQEAADYYKGLAKDWAPSLCGKSKPVTFEEVQALAKDVDSLFRFILENCNETANTDSAEVVQEVTGQDVQTKKYEDGKVSFLVNVPRFRAPRTEKSDKSGNLSVNIDGVPVQTEAPFDLNAACLKHLGMTSQDLLAQFKLAGVKFVKGSQLTVNGKHIQVTKFD